MGNLHPLKPQGCTTLLITNSSPLQIGRSPTSCSGIWWIRLWWINPMEQLPGRIFRWPHFPNPTKKLSQKKCLGKLAMKNKCVFFWERQFYNWISYLSSQKRISWLLGWIFGWGIWVFWFQTQKLKNVSRQMGEFKDHSFLHTKKNRIQIPFGQFHALSRIAFSYPSPCRWPHLEVYCQAKLVIWSVFPESCGNCFLKKTTPSLAKPILACFCCNGAVFSRHCTGAIVCGSLLLQHLCLVGLVTQPKMLPWFYSFSRDHRNS